MYPTRFESLTIFTTLFAFSWFVREIAKSEQAPIMNAKTDARSESRRNIFGSAMVMASPHAVLGIVVYNGWNLG